jgi:hypothetical protein
MACRAAKPPDEFENFLDDYALLAPIPLPALRQNHLRLRTSGGGRNATHMGGRAQVSEGSQAETALYWLEGKVYLVSRDPRGIPLLRKALESPYREIVAAGADGLARADDKDSIPLIVEACKRFHET